MPDPEIIADEYLRPGQDLRLKRNALTLLRVVGGASSAERLAREAVESEDAEVRGYAWTELRALEADADRDHALEELRKVLASSNERLLQVRAYALLSELDLGVVAGTFTGKLRLATELHLATYPHRSVAFYVRSVLPSLLGTGLAALLLVLYVSQFGLLRGDSGNAPGLMLLYALLAALIASALVTLRSVAFGLYPGFLTGALVECLTPVAIMLPLSLLGYAVAYILSAQKFGFGSFLFTAGVLLGALMAVRLGTVLAHRASRGARTSFAIQAAAGGSLGACVLIGALLVRPDAGLANYWISLTPVMFGLAVAFAWIDSGAAHANRQPGRPLAKVLAGAAVAGLAALLALPFYEISRTRIEVGPTPTRVQIDGLPRTLRFSLSRKTEVLFELTSTVPDDSKESIDTIVKLDDANHKELLTADGPERFEEMLDPGEYTVIVDDYSRESTVSQAAMFAALFGTSSGVRTATLMANVTGVAVKRETYKVSDSAPDSTPIPQLPFLKFVKPPQDGGGVYIALLGKSSPYEFALYKGAKEVVEFDSDPIHHVFTDRNSGDYLVVVKKTDSKFVPVVRFGEAVVDTVPIESGLVLYAAVHPPPTPTSYRPAGQSVTTLARAADGTDVPVTQVPFVQFVRVTGREREVVLELQDSNKYEDLTLLLFGEKGNRITSADDPETIARSLSPGLYWLVVRAYDDRREPVTMTASGEIVLPATPASSGLLLKIR